MYNVRLKKEIEFIIQRLAHQKIAAHVHRSEGSMALGVPGAGVRRLLQFCTIAMMLTSVSKVHSFT